ncbi:MAG: Sulfotransferase [Magnetococcales bacterium]|nr:Sulfotransferase [Magnetococcales bacterium]
MENGVKKVLLWGLSPFLDTIIDGLTAAGITIDGIVADAVDAAEVHGISIIKSDTLTEREPTCPPILVSSMATATDADAFLGAVREIKGRLGLSKATILHPVALADLIKLNFSGKGLIIGANRSGSTLLFHLTRGILEQGGPVSQGHREQFIEHMAKNHFNATIRHLTDAFQSEGAFYCGNGSTRFGAIDVFGSSHQAFFEITPVPARRYLFDTVHRCYPIIDADICKTVTDLGYCVLTSLRNPLDIIVSNAFELEYVFFRMFPGKKLDRVESDLRENYGRFHLNNRAWFEEMALYVKRNMEAWLQLQGVSTGIRYEDLMYHPGPAMRRLAETLGCALDDVTLESIWKRFINKPLATFKAHYFRPGEGKWRTYLDRGHMEILKKLGYPEMLAALGYAVDFETAVTTTPPPPGNPDESMKLLLAIRDAVFNMQFQTRSSRCHPDILNLQTTQPFEGLQFATNRVTFGSRFLKIITSDSYHALHNGIRMP